MPDLGRERQKADETVGSAARPVARVCAEGDVARVELCGAFVVENATAIDTMLGEIGIRSPGGRIRFDFAAVTAFDTAGAVLVLKHMRRLRLAGCEVAIAQATPVHKRLIAAVETAGAPALPAKAPSSLIIALFDMVGHGAVEVFEDGRALLVMLGELIIALLRIATLRTRVRTVALVAHLERAGLHAMPIIALINFLIGMILAQQGGFYFRSFGAEIFVVNLVGVLTTREIGVLITAIMVAGRSGSAITAEIGSMKMREEIDALVIMGLSPVDVLVVPRVLALMISLPLLVMVADFSAIAGAWLVSLAYLGFPTETFIHRLQESLTLTHITVGLLKAPVMAIVIGLVASMEGMRVEGSADSLGMQTTASVVKGIFLVVVMDGVFAMIFAAIGV